MKMYLNLDKNGRRSLRLRGWDYSWPGWYFVTICTQNRECLFGNVKDGETELTDSGRMVEKTWLEIAQKYPGIMIDEFIVMPNHIHGILGLHVGAGPPAFRLADACPFPSKSPVRIGQEEYGRIRGSAPTAVIQANWPPFQKRLWQRNYYEHIIRDEVELNHIRYYIHGNPAGWPMDEENPASSCAT